MKKPWKISSLFWQVYFSFLLIMTIPLIISTIVTVEQFKREYLKQTISAETTRAQLIGSHLTADTSVSFQTHADSLCKYLGKLTSIRITVVTPDGVVIADSDTNPAVMENHKTRPEIIAALDGKISTLSRFSHTLQKELLYVALPLYKNNQCIAIVRTAVPTTSISQARNDFYSRSLITGFILALLAAIASIFITNRISFPIKKMHFCASKFAEGDFTAKLGIIRNDEIGELADALTTMAKQLNERIRTITRQANEQEAILSSMAEGVIALDTSERILNINSAGATLLGTSETSAIGRLIHETTRNSEIQKFVSRSLAANSILEANLEISRETEIRYIHAHGSALRDHKNRIIGALIVLSDTTHQHRLENVRRDFVANVSHELRTPLTSIKGFVETLSMGAIDKPEDARRFIDIIAGQVDRLNLIIEDLLALSRIEKEHEHNAIVMTPADITKNISTAISVCKKTADAKNISLMYVPGVPIIIPINAQLFEQAIVNLLDNAIKYSNADTSVTTTVAHSASGVTISVTDMGIGIASEFHDRIFERFYRIDKARSQKQGGTGLGLSIVKHIILAHGGSVTVSSTPGNGSVFSITLSQPIH